MASQVRHWPPSRPLRCAPHGSRNPAATGLFFVLLGLKRPITVRRRPGDPDAYDLVCGEARLDASRRLGQSTIPAVTIDARQDECYVMRLVENIARRQHRPIELMAEVTNLRSRGHSENSVATKIGCTPSWGHRIVSLLEKDEEKLVTAVEMGVIPVTSTAEIAKTEGEDVQALLIYWDWTRNPSCAGSRLLDGICPEAADRLQAGDCPLARQWQVLVFSGRWRHSAKLRLHT
ncbi:ParB/RepB/Spo0J family partition protein [Phaeobacter sp. B1627]|uniref:ParB/RepB/Spo0J family partition protein n=1 Tax=Phaeobacter sp. B1627 TaxID=2583809 RepID=UPI00111B4567|nr:plasmid partitioning protein RepB C-terminal domain-containing protein [Phaeobacter sp. B1627]TNJ44845.1 hypothetical protein FGE21_07415 [Phaeobacter sp. B1627]